MRKRILREGDASEEQGAEFHFRVVPVTQTQLADVDSLIYLFVSKVSTKSYLPLR